MQNYTGVVSEKSYKDFKDRETGEDIVLKSFRIEGSGKWFRTGTRELPVGEGQAIKFSANPQNGQVDLKTVEEIEASDVRVAPKPPSHKGSSGGNYKKKGGGENWEARQVYWENKEKRDIEIVEPRITFSAAQRDAVSVVTAALAHDSLSFGNTAKGKRLDMLLDYIDQVAARFYEQRISGSFAEEATSLSSAAGPTNAAVDPEDFDE